MPDESISAAVIGVGGFGRFTLDALLAGDAVRVVGVSDRDVRTAQQVGQEAHVPFYSDNRRLLAETRPQIVYLAVPPTSAPEILSAWAERGIAVWKELPLARDLGEAVAMVRLMEKADLKFAVGTQRRFAVGYRRAHELRDRLGQVFLARAHYLFNWGPNLGWRGDLSSAGGGALLELGYHPIDLFVWMLGLPEEVYGLSAGGNRPGGSSDTDEPMAVYDTDDTAAAILRYNDGCMATVVTTRASGPVSEEISLHGRGGSLTANSETCLLRDPDGSVLDRTEEQPGAIGVFRRQAEAFAGAVLADDEFYECSARENLLNQAVTEALYLSTRTSTPENPQQLLRTHGLTAEECLASSLSRRRDDQDRYQNQNQKHSSREDEPETAF